MIKFVVITPSLGNTGLDYDYANTNIYKFCLMAFGCIGQAPVILILYIGI